MSREPNDIDSAGGHEWPERTGRPRVLVENPDRADLEAHATILRSAGYDVALCCGPRESGGTLHQCPVLEGARCSLVDGADVVVSTSSLARSDEILAELDRSQVRVVVEASAPDSDRLGRVAPAATLLPQPVTAELLERAVSDALAKGEPRA
jgi:hypothetical protein